MLQLLRTTQELEAISQNFYDLRNYPNCVGVIDGKHVTIIKPPHSGSLYYNYKKFFSIVLMTVVTANYEFIMVDVGINGRISDSGVFGYTDFGRAFANHALGIPEPAQVPNSSQKLPFVFLGDDAFTLTEYFMKPYAQAGLTLKKKIFNYRLA